MYLLQNAVKSNKLSNWIKQSLRMLCRYMQFFVDRPDGRDIRKFDSALDGAHFDKYYYISQYIKMHLIRLEYIAQTLIQGISLRFIGEHSRT